MAEKRKHGVKPDAGKDLQSVIKPEVCKEFINQTNEISKQTNVVLKVPNADVLLDENEQDTDEYEGDPEIENINTVQ